MKTEDSTKQMEQLYRKGWTLEEIGQKFGMTRQGVRDRFIRGGVEIRQPKYQRIDKEQLEQLYSDERFSVPKIAKVFFVTKPTILKALDFHGIPKRKWKKIGGYMVDFLRELKVGEQKIYQPLSENYPRLHRNAEVIGIKISIRKCGEGQFLVKRLK
jgi:predicted DNA-binding protein YlxM (UPF0122 family)